MIVDITDYGDSGDKKFIEYSVTGLDEKQLHYLENNLNEELEISGDILKIRMYFAPQLYPFQSDVAQFRLDDFIAREEIEMNVFLSSFLEDM